MKDWVTKNKICSKTHRSGFKNANHETVCLILSHCSGPQIWNKSIFQVATLKIFHILKVHLPCIWTLFWNRKVPLKNNHFFKLSEYNSFLWANYRSVQSTAVRWTFASPPSSSHSPSWTLSACERMWRGSPAPGPARSILWEHLYRLLKEVIQQIGNYKERKQFVAYLWRVQKRRLSKQKLLNRTAHKWFFDFWVKKQKSGGKWSLVR